MLGKRTDAYIPAKLVLTLSQTALEIKKKNKTTVLFLTIFAELCNLIPLGIEMWKYDGIVAVNLNRT